MHPDALEEEAVQAQGVDMDGLIREYVRVWWPKLKNLFKSIVQQYEGEDRSTLHISSLYMYHDTRRILVLLGLCGGCEGSRWLRAGGLLI